MELEKHEDDVREFLEIIKDSLRRDNSFWKELIDNITRLIEIRRRLGLPIKNAGLVTRLFLQCRDEIFPIYSYINNKEDVREIIEKVDNIINCINNNNKLKICIQAEITSSRSMENRYSKNVPNCKEVELLHINEKNHIYNIINFIDKYGIKVGIPIIHGSEKGLKFYEDSFAINYINPSFFIVNPWNYWIMRPKSRSYRDACLCEHSSEFEDDMNFLELFLEKYNNLCIYRIDVSPNSENCKGISLKIGDKKYCINFMYLNKKKHIYLKMTESTYMLTKMFSRIIESYKADKEEILDINYLLSSEKKGQNDTKMELCKAAFSLTIERILARNLTPQLYLLSTVCPTRDGINAFNLLKYLAMLEHLPLIVLYEECNSCNTKECVEEAKERAKELSIASSYVNRLQEVIGVRLEERSGRRYVLRKNDFVKCRDGAKIVDVCEIVKAFLGEGKISSVSFRLENT